MKREPAYMAVYIKLKNEIRDNELAAGTFLPPEPELERKFNVSRTTVRKAVEMLAQEGYVNVRQGRGTEVLDFPTIQDLNAVTSISETLRKKGFIVRSKRVHVDETPAGTSVAKDLHIREGEPVIRIQRLQLADECPVAIMKNYIVKEKAPDFEKRMGEGDTLSLYLFLETEYGIRINAAEDTIFAKQADFAEAEMLQVPIGSPLLCLNRVSFTDGKPVTMDRISIRHDKYEFHVAMTGRNRQ